MKGKQGKRSTDVAVLPDEFCDINNWDTKARPDSTRGRWRLGIRKCLATMEEAAVVHVTEILDREQLMMRWVDRSEQMSEVATHQLIPAR